MEKMGQKNADKGKKDTVCITHPLLFIALIRESWSFFPLELFVKYFFFIVLEQLLYCFLSTIRMCSN